MISPFLPTLEQRLPEMLRFLRSLVEVNSHTLNREGVNRNADLIEQAFAGLGFTAERLPVGREGVGDHLFLDTGGSGVPIALISHLDTVFTSEEETANDFCWREEGDRIYGPGTMDIKGGTAMIWLMLATLKEAAPALFSSVRWIVACDAEEEIGASESFYRCCMAQFPKDLAAALVFEADNRVRDGFGLLNARKGIAAYRLEVSGRGAHAGARPEQGASAILQLARTIDLLHSLNDEAKGVTVNVGKISGGTAFNRVAHEACAELEMRTYDPAIYESMRKEIESFAGEGDVRAASDHFPCRLSFTRQTQTPPWPENEGTQQLLGFWKEAAEAVGMPISISPRGGVSDGNFLVPHFPTLDGLGPRGANAHCSERSADGTREPEYVDVTSFVPKAAINLEAIRRIVAAYKAR